VGTGPSVTVCRLAGFVFSGATWGPHDSIIFAQLQSGGGLFRVSATGGEPEKTRRT